MWARCLGNWLLGKLVRRRFNSEAILGEASGPVVYAIAKQATPRNFEYVVCEVFQMGLNLQTGNAANRFEQATICSCIEGRVPPRTPEISFPLVIAEKDLILSAMTVV